MKVAYISDLHLEFYEKGFGVPAGRLHLYGSVDFPDKLDADVLVIAGDIHGSMWIRDGLKKKLEDHYGIPVIMVDGNHDYWGGPFDDTGLKMYEVNGVRIGACTFWTDLSREPLAPLLARQFVDFMYIDGLTLEKWQQRHDNDIRDLRIQKPDIIVTHHAPSFRSMEQKYGGNPINMFFLSNHDDLIRDLNPKLWIHGHVHSTWDYMVDGSQTRVVCNPYGYPGEMKSKVDVKIVEVV